MNILFIGEDLNKSRSGVVTVMNQILNDERLKGDIKFITIFTTSDNYSTRKKLYSWFKAYIKFLFYLPSCKIVHIHHASDLNFWLSSVMVFFSKMLRKKSILHNHSADFHEFYDGCSPAGKKIISKIFSLVNVNIVLSNHWLKWYKSIAPDAIWVMLQNAIDLPDNIPEKAIDDKNVALIYLARIEQRKGFYDFLKVMPAIVKEFPFIKIYLAGQGDVEDAKAAIQDQQLGQNVFLLGYINKNERDNYLRVCQVLIFPSYNEGLPMALLEAMSYGLVPITTPVGGIPDVVVSGENGILIQPGDTAALSSNILALLKDPEGYKNMSRNAVTSVHYSFNYKNYGIKLQEIYRMALITD